MTPYAAPSSAPFGGSRPGRRAGWRPAGALLAALTLTAWGHLLFTPGSGVQVINRSGHVLAGLQVCGVSGGCTRRAQLWPRQTWRVPATPGARVQVQGARMTVSRTAPTARIVVTDDGRLIAQRR